MTLIQCSGLTLSYEGKPAVSDISFTVNQGDYLCIVGENGAGKTTLIKGILGLKEPTSGVIKRSRSIRNAIGYLPQQTSIQRNFPATVFEVVLSGCLNSLGRRPFFGPSERNRARKALRLLGISGLSGKSYRELSGGQQQRVLLARALCAAHKIILLDEPVSGLDPLATKELYKLIKKINVEMNMAVIMVSHDIESAVKYGTHILHVASGGSGSDHFFGTVEDYRNSAAGIAFIQGNQGVQGFAEDASFRSFARTDADSRAAAETRRTDANAKAAADSKAAIDSRSAADARKTTLNAQNQAAKPLKNQEGGGNHV